MVSAEVSMELSVVVFSVKQSGTLGLLDPENEDTTFIDTPVTLKAPQRTTPSA